MKTFIQRWWRLWVVSAISGNVLSMSAIYMPNSVQGFAACVFIGCLAGMSLRREFDLVIRGSRMKHVVDLGTIEIKDEADIRATLDEVRRRILKKVGAA